MNYDHPKGGRCTNISRAGHHQCKGNLMTMIYRYVKKTISGRASLKPSRDETSDLTCDKQIGNGKSSESRQYSHKHISNIHIFTSSLASFQYISELVLSLKFRLSCLFGAGDEILLRSSDIVRFTLDASLFMLNSFLSSLLTEKKTVTVSRLFNLCLPGVDNLIYTKLIGSRGM